jgi:excisionase family DNA binding protein
MHNELLDVQEVAARLRVNPRTVLRMADRGELLGIKVARRWRFRSSDLDTYLQSYQPSSSEESLLEEELAEEAFANRDAQKAEQRQSMAQLDREKEQLELEKQRLSLRKERMELYTKQIDYALETANKMVNMLYPDSDAKTKAFHLEALLANLLRLGNAQDLELALPAAKNYPARVNREQAVTRTEPTHST